MANRGKMHQNAFIEKYLSMILQSDLQDEDYGIVSISGIEISPDGSKAWVTINTSASTEKKLELVDLLNENAGFIRSELAAVLQIRHTPSLTFKADLVRESAEAIEKILAEADPLPEEKAEELIVKQRSSFTFPAKKTSVETDLKSTSQKTPVRNEDRRKNVKTPKSSSNRMPS